MALRKEASNIKILVKGSLKVMAGKIIKDADEVIIDAINGKLNLNSTKKVITNGNRS